MGATNETKISGFATSTLVAFQLITRPGLARRSPQSFLIASLVAAIRSVWRQDAGVGGIIRHGFVEVFASRGLRPGVIGITNRLFGFGVTGQADGGCGKAERESEY
jgi:hypothetical protein